MAEPLLPPARYEHSDVTFRFLACGAGGVLAVILLCALGVMWLYPTAEQDRRLSSPLPVYPTPRLQTDPAADLRRFDAQQRPRIPLEEAMQRIATQGIPDWPASQSHQP